MSDASDIEWTDASWNPVRGCVKVSPGCKHCYAEAFAERFRGVEDHPFVQGFDPVLVPEKLDLPLHWRRPRRVFVNSMSDLFGEFVPFGYIAAIFGVMAVAKEHTFQALTKRPERAREFLAWVASRAADFPGGCASRQVRHPVGVCGREARRYLPTQAFPAPDMASWPLRNVHLGVSVEDRKYGLPRIDALREIPAALRWLSIEPLLEDLGEIDLSGIGWVVVGGESGGHARPCDVEHVRSVVRQCRRAKVAVFVKQLGKVSVEAVAGGLVRIPLKSRKGCDMSEWPEDLRVQEMPVTARRAA